MEPRLPHDGQEQSDQSQYQRLKLGFCPSVRVIRAPSLCYLLGVRSHYSKMDRAALAILIGPKEY
uniref:Uncharacterized protein n=1 Tax=Picea glauca TaxID=3330 RepID=A0A101LTX9_PICGL|nr:hypothetical protein ABT39_MTgene3520 [Picea glauca]